MVGKICSLCRNTIVLKWLAAIGIGVALYYFPWNEVFSTDLKFYISITVCFILIVCFDLLPTLLISMLLPCAYMLSGIADAAVALSPWTNTLMYLVTAGLILTNILSDCGLLKRISLWFISKCGDSLTKLAFGLYFICLLMACICFVQAWLLMFTMAVALCKSMGYKAGDKEATVLMMSAFCGALCSTVYVYNPSYAPLLQGAYGMAGMAADFHWYDVYLYMAPYIPVCLLFIFLLIKAYRVDKILQMHDDTSIKNELKAMGKITGKEKKAAFALLFLILFLFTSTWHKLDILFGFIIAIVYLFLPGIEVGTLAACRDVNMGTIAFMVACMSIGVVGSKVGMDTIIADAFRQLLSESGTYEILYTVFGLGALGNFVMTPLAILTSLLNPIVKIATALQVNPLGAIYTLLASIDFYILPYENSWALVFFGLGMVKMKDFIKLNLFRSILLTIALGLLFIPWWRLLSIV